MSRFVISCGGTGGHLSPGIALAEGLKARGHDSVLLISRKRVDSRLMEKYPGMDFRAISGSPFGKSPKILLKFWWTQTRGLWQSWRIVRKAKPAAIVGFGGFTSAAAIFVGVLCRIPVILHESNRVPGKAIRFFGRFAARVYVPEGVKLPKVDEKKIREFGTPVRSEIFKNNQSEARRKLGLDEGKRVISIFGGSQGARSLNDWGRAAMKRLSEIGVQLYCVTGMGGLREEERENVVVEGVRMIFTEFSDDVATLLSASDLVVARAGSGTIAEMIRCEVPSILVPYPIAADDHQRANARWLAEKGACVVVEQAVLESSTEEILNLLNDEPRMAEMRAQLELLNMNDPLKHIVDDMEALLEIKDEA